MNPAIERLLRAAGTVEEVSGHRTFFMSGGAQAWLVVEGHIDVFAVALDEGHPVGPRHFIFAAPPGGILFGLDLEHFALRYGLLAVGLPGTKVVRFPLDQLVPSARAAGELDEIETLLERFASSVAALFAAQARPPVDLFLSPGTSASAPMSGIVSAERGVVWARLESGAGAYTGQETICPAPGGVRFPLAPGLFLKTTAPARLSAISTRELLLEDPALASLGLLKTLYVTWVEGRIERRVEEEGRRLAQRRDADHRIQEKAVRDLGSVLSRDDFVSGKSDSGPLLDAMRRVGRAAGIEFQEAASWESGSDVVNPVEAICRRSMVRNRRVLLRGRWWETDSGPLLGTRREGEALVPVALLSERRARYTMVASDEERQPVTGEIAAQLDPVAYMFYKPFPARALCAMDLLRQGGESIKRDAAEILLVSLVAGLLSLAVPYASGIFFGSVIPSADRFLLFQVVVALLVSTVAGTLFELVRSIAFVRLQGRWGQIVQSSIWDRIAGLPVKFFRDFTVGDLVERANAVDTIRRALSGAALAAILTGLMSVMQFGLLFYYSAELSLWAVLISTLVAIVSAGFGLASLKYERRVEESAGRLSGLLFQIIGGIAKIRVAGAEVRAFAAWAGEFGESRRARYEAGTLQNAVMTINGIVPICSTALVYFMVDAMASTEGGSRMGIGEFIGFSASFSMFLMGAVGLSDTAVSMLNLVPVLQRARPILAAVPESDPSKPDPGPLNGRVEVSHVSFRYAAEEALVLEDVSWKAEPGEFIAIVGPSGSGKSSLLRILLGFEKAHAGNIYIGNHDLGTVDVTGIRRQIGVVLQNSRLRPGSLLENIIGLSGYTHEDALRAATMAGLEEDLKQMPMGLYTVLTEGGSTLSGGQRQRILIARALVRNPRVIIFDEATSALDNRTQQIVSASLERLNATRIVVAHRLSTIRNADRIYVMKKGRIVQTGTYDELLTQDGLFADLARRQLAE